MSKAIIVILFFIFAILLAFSPISEMREERKMKKAYDDINVGDTFISKIDKSEKCVVTEKNEYHHRIRIISYIAGDDKNQMFWNLKGFLLFTKKKQVVNNFVDNFLEKQAEHNKHCFIFAALKQ